MKAIRILLGALTMVAISSFALCQGTGDQRRDLERQLAEIDQKWEAAAKVKNFEYLKQLWTDQWVEELAWVPSAIYEADAFDRLAKANRKPGEGNVPDDFKLRAVYGNVALATDRRTNRSTDANGQVVTRQYRSLLIFVKEKGKWRSAGAALTLIVSP